MRLFSIIFFIAFSSFLFSQTNLSFLGRKTYQEELNDVWGYAANGKEYALVGIESGVSIVDVTNPAAPAELFFVSTAVSFWHDIATWNGYAYVTNETGGGLTVINLNFLPDSIHSNTWNGGIGLSRGHTVFADEKGIIYVAGGNQSAGRGILMFDANANPTQPPLVGRYDANYVHDVFVRGDTMWTAEINNGIFAVVDISNKFAPVILATNSTPNNMTHNAWLSDDGKTLLTTDEVNNARIASYDVSDLGNITLLDMFQFNPGTNSLPHNVHYYGDFAVASYYRDGVVMIDASYPDNLIAVGNYDTSPLSGGGTNGCWSVYPYLPSGIILASDIEQGLFVLAPTYVKACYLEGIVTDIASGFRINNVSVRILPNSPVKFTDLLGRYKTGIGVSGTYQVQFTKTGYRTHIENHVVLQNGVVTTLNVQMIPILSASVSGSVVDADDADGIADGHVLIKNSTHSYSAITGLNGNFNFGNVESGIYEMYAGRWGYLTQAMNIIIFKDTFFTISLPKGYYDDFLFDFGWTNISTATSVDWVRATPTGTFLNGEPSNPGADVESDFGDQCYVTGNGGGAAGNDDVDDGTVTLTSPLFNLSGYFDPYISYYRWFFNAGGNTPPDDTLFVMLSNGTDIEIIDMITADAGTNAWNLKTVRVKNYLPPSADMSIIFETSDHPATPHVVEAAVDMFSVFDSIYPPVADFTIDKIEGCPGDTFTMINLSYDQPQNWEWEFPGGTPSASSEQNPAVIYSSPGIFNIKLTATNIGGNSSVTKQAVIVIHEPPAVQAAITKASDSMSADGSIAISISGNPPYVIEWDNGSSDSFLENLSAGDYSLTVTDSNGCSTATTIRVNVAPTQPPVADFISDKASGCPGDTFVMTDLSLYQPESWLWEFPGGTPESSAEQNPFVIYNIPGEYDILLSATNDSGTHSIIKESLIIIHEPPIITANITDASSVTADDGAIIISVDSNGQVSIEWSNGETEAALQNLSHGEYSVTVTNNFNCKSSDTFAVGYATSVFEIEPAVKYFPNPFDDRIMISTSRMLDISFFNSIGIEIEKMNLLNGAKIFWGENQLPGIYFMLISSGRENHRIVKLVKIR